MQVYENEKNVQVLKECAVQIGNICHKQKGVLEYLVEEPEVFMISQSMGKVEALARQLLVCICIPIHPI